MRVIKFGGTSVGSPQRVQNIVQLIQADTNCMIVLSAMAGTTNSLVEIANKLSMNDKEQAIEITKLLKSSYMKTVTELYSTSEYLAKGFSFVEKTFQDLIYSFNDNYSALLYSKIVAYGELLSTNLFKYYLEEIHIEAVLVNALDYMRTNVHNEPDIAASSANLFEIIEKQTETKVFITQGFICRDINGDISNLGRGGSDYSAAVLGNILDASAVEIWTDIDGIRNNDPRFVERTRPVRELSFDEAAELAYFGAKILHPSTIHPCRIKNIPVVLKNTLNPSDAGTVISQKYFPSRIKAVAAKDNITAIKIISSRMLQSYGFMRRVFEIFEEYKTPVDMITTSEVAISMTIDNTANINKIIKKLQIFSTVKVDFDQSIVCIVGDMLAEKTGLASLVFKSLQDIPLRMISYGGSNHNISVLVSTEHKIQTLNVLNDIVNENSHQLITELC